MGWTPFLHRRLAWAWGLGLVACGSSDVIVAGGPASEGNGTEAPGLVSGALAGSGASAAARPSATVQGLDRESPWLGEWRGEESGSAPRALRLRLTYSEEREAVVGTLTFGDAPPPPSPDALRSYPPLDDMQARSPLVYQARPRAGFAYTVLAGSVLSERPAGASLQLVISLNELWEQWCAMQPRGYFYPASGRYGCVPSGVVQEPDGTCHGGMQAGMVDCHRVALCRPLEVCVCWPDRCSVDLSRVHRLELTLDENGDAIHGYSSLGGASIALTRISEGP